MKYPCKISKYIAIFPILLLAVSSCQNEDVHPTIDNHCKDLHPLSAEILVEEDFDRVNPVWSYYSTDTVARSVLRFTAADSLADSYRWEIGQDIFTTRSIKLYFPNDFLLNTTQVSLRLTVRRKVAGNCSLKADSVQTRSKTVHFTTETLVKGRFKGHRQKSPGDEFIIELNPFKPCSELPNGMITTTNLSISNLVQGCQMLVGTCQGGNYEIGYRQIFFNAEACQSVGGTIRIGPDNHTINIDYEVYENGYQQPSVKHRFIGTRIN